MYAYAYLDELEWLGVVTSLEWWFVCRGIIPKWLYENSYCQICQVSELYFSHIHTYCTYIHIYIYTIIYTSRTDPEGLGLSNDKHGKSWPAEMDENHARNGWLGADSPQHDQLFSTWKSRVRHMTMAWPIVMLVDLIQSDTTLRHAENCWYIYICVCRFHEMDGP